MLVSDVSQLKMMHQCQKVLGKFTKINFMHYNELLNITEAVRVMLFYFTRTELICERKKKQYQGKKKFHSYL